ncbi:DUF948 domain-containing protein [Sporosarcina sp. FA9]|uniref:DUF948 domain-containing protein n=1 Tax=Sporosarcina sp. FA9 TaxID=3413030 RepID=UPI003F65D5D6
MDWLGIGVLIIGIAFMILVFLLIKPLMKLTTVLESLQKTTDQLPSMLSDVTGQASEVFQKGNETLVNVNNQVKEINPLFQIVQDAGEASRDFSEMALEKTFALKKNTSEAKEFTQRKRFQGLYGLLAFVYYLSQKKEIIKEQLVK